MWNGNFLFLLITVLIFAIPTTVTMDMTSIAKYDNQDVTTEYPTWTPWPGFIPCQYNENSSYFCPKEKPSFGSRVGSCSSPPAPNDYYCTQEGHCQCDYDSSYTIIIIIIASSIGILGFVAIISCIICCICKNRRRVRNDARAKTYTKV